MSPNLKLLELKACTLDEFFAGAILNLLRRGTGLETLDLKDSIMSPASEALFRQLKQQTKTETKLVLPNGDMIQQIPVQSVIAVKKPARSGSHK